MREFGQAKRLVPASVLFVSGERTILIGIRPAVVADRSARETRVRFDAHDFVFKINDMCECGSTDLCIPLCSVFGIQREGADRGGRVASGALVQTHVSSPCAARGPPVRHHPIKKAKMMKGLQDSKAPHISLWP